MATFELPTQSIEVSPEIPDIADSEEAREFITKTIEQGVAPVISVPRQFAEVAKRGITPQTTWIEGLKLIAGTLGRPPYLPDNEERVVLRIVNINPDAVQPRFTGPDKHFHGVVWFKGPITPDQIEELSQN